MSEISALIPKKGLLAMSDDEEQLFDPESDGEQDPDEDDDERPELTNDELKVLHVICHATQCVYDYVCTQLLYMVSRYSHAATGPEEKEEWIRKVPLMVLIYEGIVAQVHHRTSEASCNEQCAPGLRLRLCAVL